MKAMTNSTVQRTSRFAFVLLLALWSLSQLPQAQAQSTEAESALTSRSGMPLRPLNGEKLGHNRIPMSDFAVQTNRKKSGNASGGEDDHEEDIIIILDGYQSVGGRQDRLRGQGLNEIGTQMQRKKSGNASGGEDDHEEDIIIILDGYQSVSGGRLTGQGRVLRGHLGGLAESTRKKSGNASGGEDDHEEDIIIILDGYQSVSDGRSFAGSGRDLNGFAAQTSRKKSGNASGGEDDHEEDIIIILDGYQSVRDGRLVGNVGDLDVQARRKKSGNASGGEDDHEEDIIIILDGYQSVGEADVRGDAARLGSATLPQQATLHGNYPNPFNPSTTIRFELPEAQAARLVVYNAIGQQVQVLADGHLGAGPHEVRFDAGHLASGVYLARLETAAGVSVQRMTLTK